MRMSNVAIGMSQRACINLMEAIKEDIENARYQPAAQVTNILNNLLWLMADTDNLLAQAPAHTSLGGISRGN
jgi:hypothetical protein